MCMFCGSLFVLFLLAIVLSVLRLTDSDYPVGIYKFFFIQCKSSAKTTEGKEKEIVLKYKQSKKKHEKTTAI